MAVENSEFKAKELTAFKKKYIKLYIHITVFLLNKWSLSFTVLVYVVFSICCLVLLNINIY